MELFFGSHNEEIGEWIPIEEKMPSFPGGVGKVAVKMSNGDASQAFFCDDKAVWVAKYGIKPSYFGIVRAMSLYAMLLILNT